jgi:hypothetical protein
VLWTSWQWIVEAGLAAAAVGFLYWCLQAGFYGAFGVRPAEIGIDVGTPTDLAIGYAYVGTAVAADLILAMLVAVFAARRWGHHWRILDRRILLPGSAVVFLIAGLVFQAVEDGALFEARTKRGPGIQRLRSASADC